MVNPDPSRGQLSSLQTALAEVPADAEGFSVHAGGLPGGGAGDGAVDCRVAAFRSEEEPLAGDSAISRGSGGIRCARGAS